MRARIVSANPWLWATGAALIFCWWVLIFRKGGIVLEIYWPYWFSISFLLYVGQQTGGRRHGPKLLQAGAFQRTNLMHALHWSTGLMCSRGLRKGHDPSYTTHWMVSMLSYWKQLCLALTQLNLWRSHFLTQRLYGLAAAWEHWDISRLLRGAETPLPQTPSVTQHSAKTRSLYEIDEWTRRRRKLFYTSLRFRI